MMLICSVGEDNDKESPEYETADELNEACDLSSSLHVHEQVVAMGNTAMDSTSISSSSSLSAAPIEFPLGHKSMLNTHSLIATTFDSTSKVPPTDEG